MRPTFLGSRIDKDRPDHSVYSGEWEVGRIHESPCNLCWFWLMSLNGPMKVGAKLEEIDLGCAGKGGEMLFYVRRHIGADGAFEWYVLNGHTRRRASKFFPTRAAAAAERAKLEAMIERNSQRGGNG